MIACGFTSSVTSKFSDLRAIQVNGWIARPSSDTRLARRGGLHGRTCTQTLILLIIKKTTRTVLYLRMIHVRRRRYTTCTKYTYVYNALLYVYGRVTYGTRSPTCTVVLSYSIYFRKYKLYNFMYTYVYNVVRVHYKKYEGKIRVKSG